MEPTYNYLKNVFPDLKQESKKHPAFLFVILALLAIPLNYAFISIALALLVLVTLICAKKSNFKPDAALLLPVTLFGLMALSLVWTVDMDRSVRALQKGLPLLLIPLCFMALPRFDAGQKQKIIGFYSLGMIAYTLFWLGKAAVRFVLTGDSGVFFYHELVVEDVNAIHVSVYVSIAAFHFLTKKAKTVWDKAAIALLTLFLVLLSSKNIMVIFALLAAVFYFRNASKKPAAKWILFAGLLLLLVFMGKIRDRFVAEFQSGHSINTEMSNADGNVYNVSIAQAWTQQRFNANDYFPGTAFRVYQIRIFCEMLCEDAIFLTGYGLNASATKIKEKGAQHGVYQGEAGKEGYPDKNFHNQYIQSFAELGIFGLLILLALLFTNLKNAIRTKDFVHISFAILMISLFLTESFLSRQRGIVFFTITYCLFNLGASKIALKKE